MFCVLIKNMTITLKQNINNVTQFAHIDNIFVFYAYTFSPELRLREFWFATTDFFKKNVI